jgi:glycosyltransferase involved in cell wall biosynthesis
LLKRKNDHNEVRIITVARLVKLKNIDKVIHALSRLKQKYHFRYTIAGDGPEKNYLTNLVHHYDMQDIIQLTGKIPHQEIADILCEHDIFIMPSYFETFGRVYFEAMALGLPVICAKNSGIYGFFEEMKEGISVDHANIDDIAGKLELLISDRSLRHKIGNNGNELVKQYTWKNLAIKFNRIYNDSLKKVDMNSPPST